MTLVINFLWQCWVVLGQMAPYLLFGFAMAGVLAVVLSPEWVQRHLGGRGIRPIIKAVLWGIPLPLCSCSVIPVAASMRRHGASPGATIAFLISAPQTSVDSIAVTYALLGPVFAVFRPLADLIGGVLGGMLVLLDGRASARGNDAAEEQQSACRDSCCTGDRSRSPVVRALEYGFLTLPRDLAVALLVGVVITGAMSALLPQNQLDAYLGGGILSILLLMAVGIPLYVCATASVPIAAGLIYLGASPGAALAFLITGPATNAATITAVWRVLGRRTALVYLLTVAVNAVVCGLLLDLLVPLVAAWMPQLAAPTTHHEHIAWWSHLSAVALLVVLAASYPLSRRRHAEPSDVLVNESAKAAAPVSGGECCCCSHPSGSPAPKPHPHAAS